MEIESGLLLVLEDFFRETGYKVIDTLLRGEKGTTVLEIFVDNREGIVFDELVSLSKKLNEILDNQISENNISNLIISSPGADRPLKFIWQLHKHKGRILEIEKENGEMIEGKLINIFEEGEENIELEVIIKEKNKKISQQIRLVNFKDIKNLNVKISFSKK